MSATHSTNSSSNLASDLYLPPRPPTASTPLWAHILRPSSQVPTSLSDVRVVAPPTVPLDKNATSMRVLLHDTQANFEKFTDHVAKLTDGIKETKHEMKTVHSLFERDRESLMGDIIDLVNRSQKEIQKSIGSPCQVEAVDIFFNDITHRLKGLDQRLEAMQSFNQTHSQALQTQIQAIQILLDKQGSIVTAVLPLLPLLQAVPLHIDAAKNDLKESILKLAIAPQIPYKPASSSDSNCSVSPSTRTTGKRKRISEEGQALVAQPSSSTSDSLILSRKRPRSELAPRDSPALLPSTSDAAPLFSRPPSAIRAPSPSIPFVVSHGNDNGLPPASGLSPVANAHSTTPSSRAAGGSIDNRDHQSGHTSNNFATPRRPLADLPPPWPLDRTSRPPSRRQLFQTPGSAPLQRTPSAAVAPSLFSTSLSEMFGAGIRTTNGTTDLKEVQHQEARSTSALRIDSSNILGITPTAARPPRMLRMHTSLASRNNPQASAQAGSSATDIASTTLSMPTPLKTGLAARQSLLGRRQSTVPPSNVADTNKSSPLGLVGSSLGAGMNSSLARSRPRSVSRAPAVDPLAIFNRQPTPAVEASATKQEVTDRDNPLQPNQALAQLDAGHRSLSRSASVLSVSIEKGAMARPKGKNIPLAVALRRMKERRSPVRDGRRFIPLMDSEDDEDS